MSQNSPFRVRFAPSPTGFLHVGGARTLLFNWLFARRNGATLVLRIEDTDLERSTKESESSILEDIKGLGLLWDEGPIRQSERLQIYAQKARELRDNGQAYYCFCPEELLTQKREAALKLGRSPHYDGTCKKIPPAEALTRVRGGEAAGLRFVAIQKNYVLADLVKGNVEFKVGMVGDFFITRSPSEKERASTDGEVGMPVYNFVCAIDDHLMNISHVMRGEDHLSNTARQLMIMDAFGWTPPLYAHFGTVLGADRQKLSKRNGDSSVRDYLEKGFLPQALVNFLSLLGWSPKNEKREGAIHPEIFSIDELVNIFSVDGLQKSPGVFDAQKLRWMNAHFIRHLPRADVKSKLIKFLPKDLSEWEPKLELLIDALASEMTTLCDFEPLLRDLVSTVPKLGDDAKTWLESEDAARVAQELVIGLNGAPSPTEESVHRLQKEIGAKLGLSGKKLFMPMRVLLTGQTHGPELKKIIPIFGNAWALKRIDWFLSPASRVATTSEGKSL